MQTSFLSKVSKEEQTPPKSQQLDLEAPEEESYKKTFDYWKGTNVFYFSGRLILGPEGESMYARLFLIAIALFSFIFYFIMLPQLSKKHNTIICFGFTLCLLLFMFFYVLTAITEPGYLPHQNLLRVPDTLRLNESVNRAIVKDICGTVDYNFEGINNLNLTPNSENSKKELSKSEKEEEEVVSEEKDNKQEEEEVVEREEEEDDKEEIAEEKVPSNEENDIEKPMVDEEEPVSQANQDLLQGSQNEPPLSNSQSRPSNMQSKSSCLLVDDLHTSNFSKKPLKYCFYCKIYKLERTAHCSRCNSCVRVFDHHCTLVNNCIGKRNYKYFIGTVIFGFLLNLYFVTCLVLFYNKNEIINETPMKVIFGIIGMQCFIVFAFCLFHLAMFLVFKKTTKEFIADISINKSCKEKFDFWMRSASLINYQKLINTGQANWLVDGY